MISTTRTTAHPSAELRPSVPPEAESGVFSPVVEPVVEPAAQPGPAAAPSKRGVVFDVMGTLFDLSSMRARFESAGAPGAALEAWMSRTLHTAAAMTLAGRFAPFDEIALATMATTLAQTGGHSSRARDVVKGLTELQAYPDAAEALEVISGTGAHVIALSNGTEKNTHHLIDAAGLAHSFRMVVTVGEVQAYKPHPAPYQRAVTLLGLPAARTTMVAAHAWDVMGAAATGMQALWIDREEQHWPLPIPEPPRAASLAEAAKLLSAAS